jgi:hypothetical protein
VLSSSVETLNYWAVAYPRNRLPNDATGFPGIFCLWAGFHGVGPQNRSKPGLPKEAIRAIFAWHGKTQWVPVGLWAPGGCGFSFVSTKVLGIGLAQGIDFVMDMFLPNLPRTCPVAIPVCVRQCAFYHQWSKGVRDRVDRL